MDSGQSVSLGRVCRNFCRQRLALARHTFQVPAQNMQGPLIPHDLTSGESGQSVPKCNIFRIFELDKSQK